MARKKVTLAFIADNTRRKTCYKKRKAGLIKKVEEIKTLCDIDVCAIIYGPDQVWPEVCPSKEEALAIVDRFNDLPEYERLLRMSNHDNFIRTQTRKLRTKYESVQKDNIQNNVEMFVYQSWLNNNANLDQFDMRCKGEVGRTLNRMLRDVASRIDTLKIKDGDPSVASASTSAPFSGAGAFVPGSTFADE